MRSVRFEAWFASWNNLLDEDVELMWDGETYTSYRYHVEIAWAAWQQAVNGASS